MSFIYISRIHIFFLIFLINCNLYSTPLVDTNWISKNLCKKDIKIIEVGKSFNSFKVEHINCASYTNFYNDGWRENLKGVSMSLPDPQKLANIIEGLGVSVSDYVVLYPKKNDIFAMSEVTTIYFTFKYLGHTKISILDGGYPKFKKDHPLLIEEGEMIKNEKKRYAFTIDKSILANEQNIKENIANKINIIDSREVDFFLGINKLPGFNNFGTIKNSINIPSMWNLENRGLKFNNIETLKKIHNVNKINQKENNIYFCYAGLESSLNWFVSHELLKNDNAKLYEGSIFDWHSRNNSLFKKF